MKRQIQTLLVIGATLAAASIKADVNLALSTAGDGSGIQFNGASDSFQFIPSSHGDNKGYEFSFELANLDDYNGNFTTAGATYNPAGQLTSSGLWHYNAPSQTATSISISQPATITIGNKTDGFLTGTVSFESLQYSGQVGNFNNLNNLAIVNINALTYTKGTTDNSVFDADLGALVSKKDTLVLQFTFPSPTTKTPQPTSLYSLSQGGPWKTTFSGSMDVVPVPESSTSIAGLGALGLVALIGAGAARKRSNVIRIG